ncbi:hypothetical protein IU449_27040 [Nocardia higoensis]|uniref:Transmembrane protein n=1 Tax=Nocardia higoensis TaxID=228599 RepID=A0ABS0DKR6_9NOCA|nr:hypothetical protein [Nocardia higoensis]MBF6358157.1 hypothetical protein [Nocardia higoensis]
MGVAPNFEVDSPEYHLGIRVFNVSGETDLTAGKRGDANTLIWFTAGSTLTLTYLKMLGEIDWPWWGVLIPVWAFIGYVLGVVLFAGVLYGILRGVKRFAKWMETRQN